MNNEGSNLTRLQMTTIVVLRVLIGWHFLYEGVAKFLKPNRSAAGYLMQSRGWFAPLFHWIADTPSVLAIVNQMNIWGLMAIGLEHGRDFESEDRLGAWGLAQEFRRRFEAEMGNIGCRELTGADLTTEEGRKAYRSSDKPIYVCLRAGGVSCQIALDLLKEAEETVQP